jgi:hypothetical protein
MAIKPRFTVCVAEPVRSLGAFTGRTCEVISGLSPEVERARKVVETGQRMVRDVARYFQVQADEQKGNDRGGDIRARLLYEAIWKERTAANDEQAAPHDKIREDRRARRERQIAEQTPEGQRPPAAAPPDLVPADVPIQPAERKALSVPDATQ